MSREKLGWPSISAIESMSAESENGGSAGGEGESIRRLSQRGAANVGGNLAKCNQLA